MTIIDHLSLGVADVPAAHVFYSRVLDTFGIRCLAEGEGFAAFGRDRIAFLLLTPFDGGLASAGNGAHVAFAAPAREAVARAHAAGLDAGAIDEGAPGVRAAYPMPGVFAAYLRDPWGNKIELVHGVFSA
ncbi:MAG: VOC family protein [Rhizobiaceae bacterium]|uniref:VOC family protein n=1 Tax=Albidovulum sp. TaxID=1872424 RepID=UPI0013AB2667|nr:MAG: VOC family protein [Rhizobiaceae bacterium]CAG1013466.1 lactoylglutathione lyase [Rhizobiaceae bacterium]